MRLSLSLCAVAGLALTSAAIPLSATAGDGQTYKVELNKTEIVRLPAAASSIIVGNPKIADITVQSVDTIFVVGRGFGETNLIILDAYGNTMMDAELQVVNTLPSHGVRLYNGTDRETYSCIPYCGPSPVLGDNPRFISQNTTQEEELDPFTAFINSVTQTASTAAANNERTAGGPVSVPPTPAVPN